MKNGLRSLADITQEIFLLDERRRALQMEYDAAIHARGIKILQLFDDNNQNFRQISKEVGMSWLAVKHFLFNHGRTVQGREARRAQLASLRSDA